VIAEICWRNQPVNAFIGCYQVFLSRNFLYRLTAILFKPLLLEANKGIPTIANSITSTVISYSVAPIY
jgi:hypothetical protein